MADNGESSVCRRFFLWSQDNQFQCKLVQLTRFNLQNTSSQVNQDQGTEPWAKSEYQLHPADSDPAGSLAFMEPATGAFVRGLPLLNLIDFEPGLIQTS